MDVRKENKILLLVFGSLGVMIIFYFVPDGPEYQLTLSTTMITWQSHIYYACEHISRLCLISALFYALPKYARMLHVFFALELITLVDYVVRYNEDFIPGIDINTIKLIIYGLLIGRQLVSNLRIATYETDKNT